MKTKHMDENVISIAQSEPSCMKTVTFQCYYVTHSSSVNIWLVLESVLQ